MNQALAQMGSSYRVPGVQQERAAPINGPAYQQALQERARREAEAAKPDEGSQKLWGLVNMAANMYTGGAFGAATGGVSSNGLGNQQGGQDGLMRAATGILGAQAGGGGAGGWTPNESITQSYLKGR